MPRFVVIVRHDDEKYPYEVTANNHTDAVTKAAVNITDVVKVLLVTKEWSPDLVYSEKIYTT